ncbi:2-oxo-tetronate isomerase [Rubrivivax benzoatilyticus]|uniref:Hydroxypyruvate isomerase family protein n=1 Tax=Rubrivivax benzoatilyticus TaxID=316997 RepID=A0ABX0HRJ4_9BURK|nr:2-oxo-tetronate isomerase [Rubrivivax benzoatilyticus]EGJ10207.1 hydroxypyruvate isomerase [Rubrivivax benzoatilyticus JA2 = ATCC BAA-35]NHK96916.1 hydroxypyruvate isomerase family protein [Rubrivivax benzoatilyticus]NHL24631.1 hydroxypyruvate isomerase family protein [Rubrivivax benzoatilyticus]
MPRFAANLSLMYPEKPFLERFRAAAQDGFEGVEYLFPYEHDAATLRALLDEHGLTQVLFNAPPGDWAGGERGLASLPGREAEFREGIERALACARVLGCRRVHVMSGLLPAGVRREERLALWHDNLAWAAARALAAGCTLLIEPINQRDMPGYFLSRQQDAHDAVQALGSPALKVQMDLYHCQITEGDLAMQLRRWLPSGQVGHLQIAGVPERHEPDRGEVHYPYLFELIDELAAQGHWDGWIGCEYRPARGGRPLGTSSGLTWLHRERAGGRRRG